MFSDVYYIAMTVIDNTGHVEAFYSEDYDFVQNKQRFDWHPIGDIFTATHTVIHRFDLNRTYSFNSSSCTVSDLKFPMQEPDFLKDATYCGKTVIDDVKCVCWNMPPRLLMNIKRLSCGHLADSYKFYSTADTCEPIPMRSVYPDHTVVFSQSAHGLLWPNTRYANHRYRRDEFDSSTFEPPSFCK